MKNIKGPAIFLAQFAQSEAPFNTLNGLCQWAADLGYIFDQLNERIAKLEEKI